MDVVRSLRIASGDVAFATAFATLTTGTFLVGFVQSLHGSDLWIGVLSAIPSLVGIVQIPGAIWGRGFTGFKSFITPGGAAWRIFYIPLVFLPLLGIADGLRLTILTMCVLLAAVSINVVTPIYNDWMAEIVPATSRGAFFGRRNAIAAATAAVVGFAGAYLLDMQRAVHHEAFGFSAIFALAIICAFASMFVFMRMPEVKRENPIRQDFRGALRAMKTPFGDKAYRVVLGFLVVFVFGQMFAGNLYMAYARESLQLSYKIIQTTQIMMAIGIVAGGAVWGFVSDRYGNKPVLVMVGVGLATLPWPWIICQPHHTVSNAIFSGFVWSGINLCQFNLILSTAKESDRANYIAAATAVTALVGGLSPLAGAAVMAMMRPHLGPEWAYRWVFIATCILRIAALFFLVPVREKGSSPVGKTLSDLRSVTPRGYRAMRKLAKSSGHATRAEALERIGEAGTILAAGSIAKALQDPVPMVRRQAATALGRLKDSRGVRDLIAVIEEHPDLLEEETIEALGTLRNPAARPILVHTLSNPRSMLRRAAALALGKIEGPESIAPLAAAAADQSDQALRQAALTALRSVGFGEFEYVIEDALLDPMPFIRVAAAEAVYELAVASAAPALRRSLAEFRDEASSEVAYALGAVGEESDLVTIIADAAHQKSVTARRRSLLGAARLLEVESEVYRLLVQDGLARDQALLELIQPMIRAQRRIQAAIRSYSEHDEPSALRALRRVHRYEQLDGEVPELVIVAFAVAAKQHSRRKHRG